jgi:post-segregation antitoxin (ccd killing protein)
VYSMCIARVNVYLPDELAERARAAGVSISAVTQDALRRALGGINTDRWLDHLEQTPGTDVPHRSVIHALDEARDEFGARSDH